MRTFSTFLHRHWQELHVKTAPLKHISPPFRDKFFFFQFLWGVLGLRKKDPPIFLIFFNFFFNFFMYVYIYPGKGVLLCCQHFFFFFFPFLFGRYRSIKLQQHKTKQKKKPPFCFFLWRSVIYLCMHMFCFRWQN